MIFEQKLSAVLANKPGAAAYLLEMNVPEQHRPRVQDMAAQLKRRFETEQIQGQLVVFLRRPLSPLNGAP